VGKEIALQFQDCLKHNRIRLSADAASFSEKELRVAGNDLGEAEAGLSQSRWKWSTIQAYFSMFHSARALVFKKGYREKSPYCLRVALEYLYAADVPQNLIEDFQTAKIMRENADYEEDFSDIGAKKAVKSAREFFEIAAKILGQPA
jgi:uncharacterized protein (UPF0332 family)